MAEKKKQFFSAETNLLYQLYGDPPILKISGVPMHRHIHITPLQDTETKIEAAKPKGHVLDTCTGLGYTAIYAARLKGVIKVTTTEKDANVLEIAKMNEYSRELFDNNKIEIMNADISEKIADFKDGAFDVIIHDPPTFARAVDLYTAKFYSQLFRVLKKKGRLWHYCPNPGKMKRISLRERIIKNLKTAGFINVRYDEKSSGIIAEK